MRERDREATSVRRPGFEPEDKILDADAVRDAVRGLRYGSIEIVIHDGRVVQVTRTEKVRIERRDATR